MQFSACLSYQSLLRLKSVHPKKHVIQQIVLSYDVMSKKKTFCGFPWVETSTAGRVYDLCVYYMTGAPEGSPKVVLCGFMVLGSDITPCIKIDKPLSVLQILLKLFNDVRRNNVAYIQGSSH